MPVWDLKPPSEQGSLTGTVLVVRVLILFLNHFAVTTKHSVTSENNKQQCARKMSGLGKCVEQNKQRKIDTATCIPQANELLLLVSVLTFTIVITLLKKGRRHAATYTNAHTYAAGSSPRLPWQQKKPGSHLVQIVAQYQLNIILPAAHCLSLQWLLVCKIREVFTWEQLLHSNSVSIPACNLLCLPLSLCFSLVSPLSVFLASTNLNSPPQVSL